MLGLTVKVQMAAQRLGQTLRQILREEKGGVDELLMRGLFVVAVLGVAAAVIAYFAGLNNWIGGKLQTFMDTH